MIEIVQGNCDAILPRMLEAGKRVDLILTDPPYNIHKDFGNDSDCLPLDTFLSLSKSRIALCHRLLKPSGSIIWFGIHHYIGFIQGIMYAEGLYYRRMNIWFYENGFSRSKREPQTQYEPFLWFSNSNKTWTYNCDDVRVPYKSAERLRTPVYYRTTSGEKREWLPNPKGAMRGDIWAFPTLAGSLYASERTAHPSQKPEALILELIKAFCPKNKEGYYEGTILDPFSGSGTTAVCCRKLNKLGHKIRCIGIELEKRWCDVARERLNQLNDLFT